MTTTKFCSVDYNTPNDLPTFIEAIYDTLTDKAKSRLREFSGSAPSFTRA